MSRLNDESNSSSTAARASSTRVLRPTRGRTAILITMIVALIASCGFQYLAYAKRSRAIYGEQKETGRSARPSRLANLDSFSLALLLGGLRGPLVMFLWTSSESQKGEKDLESFDTKVELIRLLQPEFATVLLFQMWNKAYNISVQMASLANKYATILDAIRYGLEHDEANPDDINIIMTIGSLYADKLGNSAEKEYYRKRLRTETLPVYRVTFPAGRTEQFKKAAVQAGLDPERIRLTNARDAGAGGGSVTATLEKLVGDRVRAVFFGEDVQYTLVPRQALRPPSLGGRRTEMDTLLDSGGNILGRYVEPEYPVADPTRQNNGAELQYLEQFQPFPYGISPIALGYNYYKRAQVIQASGTQRHLQVSEQVVDSQPALGLEQWTKEEFERARRQELSGLEKAGADAAKQKPELQTASLGPANAKVVDEPAVREAVFSYGRAARVAKASFPEFQQHIERWPSNLQNYRSHADELRALMHLAQGDGAVLEAVLAKDNPGQRQRLVGEAKKAYADAAKWYRILVLKYYTDEYDARAVGYDRATVEDKSAQEVADLMKKVDAHVAAKYKTPEQTPHGSDRAEYQERLTRIATREKVLEQK